YMAIAYSGRAYVPLDPAAPAEKLGKIASNASLKLILGPESSREHILTVGEDIAFLVPDNAYVSDDVCTKGLTSCSKDSPLYIIYTSGSTGTPKGVLKSHGAAISFIEAYVDTFDFDDEDIIGNQTPFFFDASAKDILLCLKKAVTMEILPTEFFTMTPKLINYMNETGVTFISWVPSALSVVVQLNTFKAVMPTTLKKVFFVGEVMPMKHLNSWRAALPDLTYVNLYGQSELAGICSFFPVTGEWDAAATLPIGKPLKNTKIYLINELGGIITEADKTGEMYLESDALALGYYNDPEKTAAAFVMRDFDGQGLRRVFKTGDLARYDKDGNIVFASRNDFQIKHMGHRIELGEIETAADSLDVVARSCCLYNAEKGKIVIFIQPAQGAEVTVADLKGKFKEILSSYMVPNKIVILEALPLNANQKIDRQKLKEQL
ncbi:MAG: AMP-binding protein, partial [Parasporobacterium sp.]|nr:AMP-binding protein [Parasporobacterium sp.]